jgi:hypothetical protein
LLRPADLADPITSQSVYFGIQDRTILKIADRHKKVLE